MKFSVSSSALLSLLATTGKVISNKNTLPILDYFLMELKGDELRVTTSDLETTLVGSIRVDGVESGGTIAAPAKLMLDSLKEFAEMPLTIEVNDQNWEIRLSWKSGSLSIPGASAVSYPAIPALSADCKELTLDVDVLVNGINKTIFATADDELRPVMNGVYINLAPSMLTFVGTDAHKLVKYEVETANEVASSFILPKKPANLLKSVLLAVAASLAAWRAGRVTLPLLAGVVLFYQLFGSLGEWAWTGSAKAALQDIRIGLPGMLAQVFAGYAVLRYLLRN